MIDAYFLITSYPNFLYKIFQHYEQVYIIIITFFNFKFINNK